MIVQLDLRVHGFLDTLVLSIILSVCLFRLLRFMNEDKSKEKETYQILTFTVKNPIE